MVAYVYMLRCRDGSYYVGSTRDLAHRLWEHNEGLGATYTSRRRPVELVWSAEYANVGDAFAWEKRIQGWSRAKREALINHDYDRLPALAKKDFSRRWARRAPDDVVAVIDEFLSDIDGRRPGLVGGLYLHGSLCWGEFFPDSDIDFVGVLSRTPDADDLAALAAAHERVRKAVPHRRFEGFHCLVGDLAAPSAALGVVPAHYEGAFDAAGRVDVNPVTWHELAERGMVVRGGKPRVHTDLDELLAFTWDNLASYWRPVLDRIIDAGDRAVGERADSVVRVTLGVARLHHLLARRELTSMSGAGRYVLDALDPRWHLVAQEALTIREQPGTASQYDDPALRGRDVRKFLTWAIEDGRRLR